MKFESCLLACLDGVLDATRFSVVGSLANYESVISISVFKLNVAAFALNHWLLCTAAVRDFNWLIKEVQDSFLCKKASALSLSLHISQLPYLGE